MLGFNSPFVVYAKPRAAASPKRNPNAGTGGGGRAFTGVGRSKLNIRQTDS